MACISPPEPEDSLLMAFLDGAAGQELTLHLQQCLHCRERAEALARDQNLLTSRLFRISCPSAIELGEYHLRMLAPPQMLVISQHLRECHHCAREIGQLDQFLSDIAPPQKNNLLEHTKILIAHLVGRPGESNLAGEISFALRGNDKAPITFEVDDILIVINVQPAPEGILTILGQIAVDNPDEWTDALVRWHQDHLLEGTSKVDDLGTFRCEGVLTGWIDLQIVARNNTRIALPSFEVSV